MRERARDKGRLEDILEYSNNVTMLIEGHTLKTFVDNKSTYYSVMKNLEIVGEAAYMLSKAFKKAHPATPWKTEQGMRQVNLLSAPLGFGEFDMNDAENGCVRLFMMPDVFMQNILNSNVMTISSNTAKEPVSMTCMPSLTFREQLENCPRIKAKMIETD